ncbi:uncharacterized protein FFB20_05866 [Fusarium fujikuroi]|nr:uncharacterized protein FFB20_05866 [Fusarium fujikuroi]
MDPLSVIASVAGIATAAGEVIKILRPYTTAAKDAPVIAAEVSSEALATQTIITGLEQLISNFSAANVRYASLIQVDQLTAVLFDGVKIFSELLAVLQTLPPLEPSSPGGSLWTPIQWANGRLMQQKVISLVRLLLTSLTKAGMIQAIVFESAPNIFAVEPNPASLAVDAFLCDERLYLKRLGILFETVKEIRSFRNLPIDSFDSMFAPIGPLINVQTKFLIKAEILASKPYSQQSWQLPFQEWALHSSTCYATLITGQAETKSMIRAALSLADVRDVERRGALGDFLTILGLPSQQLDKYDAFLKEITQYGFHQPDHIDSAKRSLNLVKEAVNKANITQELNHARAALSKDQDYETNKALWGLGKLLMYDKVDIVDARQEDARQEKFVTAESCQEFDPSKYDPYCRMCVIDDGFASIDVIDATGQEDYSAMRQQFIREGAGFMLVYNVTSRRSFEEITTYYHQILKQKDEDHFPVVIVGIDRFQESLREVMTREGESLAEELGCTFVEVDAKSSDEVDGAFFDLVREVRWYRRDLRGY